MPVFRLFYRVSYPTLVDRVLVGRFEYRNFGVLTRIAQPLVKRHTDFVIFGEFYIAPAFKIKRILIVNLEERKPLVNLVFVRIAFGGFEQELARLVISAEPL